MRIVTVGLHLLLLVLFLHLVTSDQGSVQIQVVNKYEPKVDVVVNVSACSVTCGVGFKTETLCSVKDARLVQPKNGTGLQAGTKDPEKWRVSESCYVRMVKCTETLRCGLSTLTVSPGERAELDCVGEITEVLGKFSWRVSWRFARGLITSDEALFGRLDVPQLDKLILDPVKEENAGTYRCIVQDGTFRRVKTVFWGVRVLPEDFLNLDYESALAQWDSPGDQDQTTDQYDLWVTLLIMVLIGLSVAVIGTGLDWMKKRREFSHM